MIVISSPPRKSFLCTSIKILLKFISLFFEDVKSASFGGLLGLGASVKGVQGIIVDGRCRDLAELRAMELPVR